ncbi:MAG: DUF6691 family protein [Bauldia sp.]
MSRRAILQVAVAAGAGIVFGVGLAIAQMTDPQKVKAFLDVATIFDGNWDPSLAFVMGAGLVVMILFYRLARPLTAPLLAPAFVWPRAGKVDRKLVFGSAVFGIGWGISGFCPGPAIADLGLVPGDVILFVVAMLAGSWGAGAAMQFWSQGGTFARTNVPAA